MNRASAIRITYTVAWGTAWVAGLFSLVVLVFLATGVARLETTDPLDAGSLAALKEMLNADPDNALLKEQIRSFDQLARKAFFTGHAFIHTGGWLLLAGVVTTLSALKLQDTVHPQLAGPPGEDEAAAPARQSALARRGVFGLGAMVAVAAVGLIVWTHEPVELAVAPAVPVSAAPYPGWSEFEANWPSFRGPGGTGSAVTRDAPTHWDGATGEAVRWKTAVPLPGFGSPVVWGSRVFLSGASEERLAVFCFDADSGALLWERDVPSARGGVEAWPQVTEDTGYAAPTLATDGRHAVALFGTGDLVAFDPQGHLAWSRDLGEPENSYGHASSLSIFEGRVLVQLDQNEEARVYAFDTVTGDRVWERERKVDPSWTSPALIHHHGRPMWITSATPWVIAYDPADGAVLWELDCMGGEIAPSPAYGDGLLIAASDYPRLAAIDPGTGSMLWEVEDDLPDVPSPVVSDDYVVMMISDGTVTCLRREDGGVAWQEELDAMIYGSPIRVGNRFYVIDVSGVTHVFEDGPAFRRVATNPLGEGSTCTPAFVNQRIYIRGEKHLFCIETPQR